PVQRAARSGDLASGVPSQRGPLRPAPPSGGSAVPAPLRRRPARKEQAAADRDPPCLHDQRREKRACRAELREGLNRQPASPRPPAVPVGGWSKYSTPVRQIGPARRRKPSRPPSIFCARLVRELRGVCRSCFLLWARRGGRSDRDLSC